jgi:hypothetical protein
MLEKLVNGDRADWENRLGPALTAVRNNVSVVTGFAPFMLHNARPARHTIGRMVDGTTNPTWSARLQLQAEIMQQSARATEESRRHNRERLERKANAKDISPGDQVMIKGQRLTPLTAKWDHHYTVTGVRGKVITVLHNPTGKVGCWNRNKVRLVDPEISWEGINLRPKAQQRPQVPPTNVPLLQERVDLQEVDTPLLPTADEAVAVKPRVPPLVIRRYPAHVSDKQYSVHQKRGPTQPQHPLQYMDTSRPGTSKRPATDYDLERPDPKSSRWDHEAMEVLCFCWDYCRAKGE